MPNITVQINWVCYYTDADADDDSDDDADADVDADKDTHAHAHAHAHDVHRDYMCSEHEHKIELLDLHLALHLDLELAPGKACTWTIEHWDGRTEADHMGSHARPAHIAKQCRCLMPQPSILARCDGCTEADHIGNHASFAQFVKKCRTYEAASTPAAYNLDCVKYEV